MSRLQSASLALAGLASVAAAQTAEGRRPERLDSWLIPIHTSATDPVGGDYGLWAAGPDYKVSFHDGVTFYPLPARASDGHRPLQWRTQAILVGAQPLAELATRPDADREPWRCRFEHGAVTEIYDVRADGVEQSFVLHRDPGTAGDLVVVGRVTTGLRAAPRTAQPGALDFCDEQGRPVVRYGAACAIDTDGRSTDLATAWDGDCVRLIVPGDWLRDASYPVTIDPLTSRVWLYGAPSASGGGEVLDSDVVLPADDSLADPGLTLVVHSREFASGDVDAYGIVADRDLGNRATIWTDITTAWSTRRPRCSHVGRLDRWVVVFERQFTSGSSGVRAFVQQRSDRNLNAGSLFYSTAPSGSSQYRPDVGGSTGFNNSSDNCLVVYEQGPTGSTPSLVFGALLDPLGGFATGYDLHRGAGSNRTCSRPSVIKHARGTSTFPWVVAWQQRDANDPNDDWDLYVNRVYPDATRSLEAEVGPYASATISAYSPRVDGDWGSYLIAYDRGQLFVPTQVGYQRFDWAQGSGPPSLKAERTLRRPLSYYGTAHAIAFDHDTRSHWVIVYQNSASDVGVMRVGHSGGTIESATLHSFGSGAGAGGAAFGTRYHEFALTAADVDLLYPLYGRRMTYPAASTSTYGSSCNAPAGLVAHRDPFAGDGNFQVTVGFPSGLTTTAALLASSSRDSWLIPGAEPCRGYLSMAAMFVADTRSNVTFNTFFAIPLPDDPVFVGDVYFQVVYLNTTANPLGLETTNGLLVNVR
ncbi:MAG: hypothetical protein IPM29_29760 [Planctomycetes bacterium]|nr:hypothetical protein [Planctomycetota bacterium]